MNILNEPATTLPNQAIINVNLTFCRVLDIGGNGGFMAANALVGNRDIEITKKSCRLGKSNVYK